MKALLIRHAQSSGQGAEAALTELGQAQAEALVPVLLALGAGPLYSSPFRRAIATIEPYAVRTSQPVTPLPGLQERMLSPTPLPDWQDHIAASFTDPDHAPAGGESFTDLRARARPELSRVAEAAGPLPVMISHGNLISALLQRADPSFGFKDWQALRNPDLLQVTLAAGEITDFTRTELEFSS
jgi:2,3-bisphosphoglycerate-dependent phosphoglycerate mutase